MHKRNVSTNPVFQTRSYRSQAITLNQGQSVKEVTIPKLLQSAVQENELGSKHEQREKEKEQEKENEEEKDMQDIAEDTIQQVQLDVQQKQYIRIPHDLYLGLQAEIKQLKKDIQKYKKTCC